MKKSLIVLSLILINSVLYGSSRLYSSFNDMIVSMSNQLKNNNKVKFKDDDTVVLVSFVDLNNLSSTSEFGRLLSESLINELFTRGFNIVEYRGIKNNISLDKNGEFYISRDINKIRQEVESNYIALGTYSKINSNIVAINARIIDSKSGKVVSTAKNLYKISNKRLKLVSYKLSF